MKCSTTMAIICCGALALAVTGCKYDEPNPDDLANNGAQDIASENAGETDADMNAAKDVDSAADPNADEASLAGITGVPFDQDPNYARCTDVDFVPVFFGFDASQLAPSELAKIEAVAKHLQDKPNRVVIVEGNCDERGSNEYNLSLGDSRAISIRDYLVQLGIDAQRIQSKSYGEEKPAVSGHDEGAWSKNRRGEFAVFQHK